MPAALPPMGHYDLEVISRTVWAEARGEPVGGQLAVIWVIRNRVETQRRWPDSAAGVCLAPMQFSCWNKGPQLNRIKGLVGQAPEPLRLAEIKDWAVQIWAGGCYDVSEGANHYLNLEATRAGRRNHDLPDWVDLGKVTTTIGRHTFLKL